VLSARLQLAHIKNRLKTPKSPRSERVNAIKINEIKIWSLWCNMIIIIEVIIPDNWKVFHQYALSNVVSNHVLWKTSCHTDHTHVYDVYLTLIKNTLQNWICHSEFILTKSFLAWVISRWDQFHNSLYLQAEIWVQKYCTDDVISVNPVYRSLIVSQITTFQMAK